MSAGTCRLPSKVLCKSTSHSTRSEAVNHNEQGVVGGTTLNLTWRTASNDSIVMGERQSTKLGVVTVRMQNTLASMASLNFK